MSASYAVVGGGISGLVAAYRLRVAAGPDATITVFDPADRLGGVLRTERIGGQPLDVGAEAFIARRPEVPALLAELGLAGRQIGTTGARPLIFSQGRLHPLPTDTLQGIPAQPQALAGLVDDATVGRMLDERARPFSWRPGADPSVADLVGERFGEQVVTRSVDPLLAGVYAGSAATIGLRSAAPTLAAALDRGARNLTDAVREALPAPRAGRCSARSMADTRCWSTSSSAGQASGGRRWQSDGSTAHHGAGNWLTTRGSAGSPTRRCWPSLRRSCRVWSRGWHRGRRRRPDASRSRRRLWWRWRCRAAPRCPSSPGCWWRAENGCAPRRLHSRAASGGDAATSSWCGSRTAGLATPPKPTQPTTPATKICCRGPRRPRHVFGVNEEPVDCHVHRWIDAMPQYGPGHADMVADLRAGLPPTLAVAGGYLDGIGVPACVAAATRAAASLVTARVAR